MPTVARCAPRPKAVTGPATTAPSARRAPSCIWPSTRGHLLALHVTPATADDRTEVERLAAAVQQVTGESVELAFVDQGYTGEKPAAAAKQHGITLEVVRLPQAKRGFVLLPRRWVVERSFAWATKCRVSLR